MHTIIEARSGNPFVYGVDRIERLPNGDVRAWRDGEADVIFSDARDVIAVDPECTEQTWRCGCVVCYTTRKTTNELNAYDR